MNYQLQLMSVAKLPSPKELLNRKVRLDLGTGEVWTTIISVSTIANDNGYPELGVAPANFKGDPIVGVEIREEGRFFCRYTHQPDGEISSVLCPCKLTLL